MKNAVSTWEDMQRIWQIFDIMYDECKKSKPEWMFGSETFFSEALKRYNETQSL